MLMTPLFLLGFLGLALPWWLHRLETQTTEREKFATTRFMEASKKRIHVQRKLKYLLLMAVRMAFLALLALAFARPILLDDPIFSLRDDSQHHIIVLDTSFSMHEGSRMESARSLAAGILFAAGSDDVASLYTASSSVSAIARPGRDFGEIQGLLGSIQPDKGRLDFGAMISALERQLEESQGSVVLHVISDFQQSGQALRFADMIPKVVNNRPVTLQIHQAVTDNQANSTIETVFVENRNTVIAGVRSINLPAGSTLTKELQLDINGVRQQQQTHTISNNGLLLVEFRDVQFAEGDNRVDIRLGPNDSLAEDDLRHTVFDNSPPAPVLLLTADPASLGVTYISAALETAPRGYLVEVVDIATFDPRIMQRYPWLIVEDIGSISGNLEAALRDYVNGGGSVLAAAGPRTARLSTLPVLGNSITAPQTGPGGRVLTLPITRIDSSHPALNESAGWSSINVRAPQVATTANDRVLIAQNPRSPVLLERNIGAGRFMLFTSSLDNSASDLPVKPVFVTFMAEVARYLSNERLLVKQQVVDSFLQLAQSGGASGQVIDPDGQTLLSLQDTTRNQDVLLNKTGYYQVFTPAGEVLVAVNPDIRESDLTLMPAQTLQNWQNSVSGSSSVLTPSDSATQTAEAEPDEIEIWRFFLILLALFLLMESLLGNRYLNLKTGPA